MFELLKLFYEHPGTDALLIIPITWSIALAWWLRGYTIMTTSHEKTLDRMQPWMDKQAEMMIKLSQAVVDLESWRKEHQVEAAHRDANIASFRDLTNKLAGIVEMIVKDHK